MPTAGDRRLALTRRPEQRVEPVVRGPARGRQWRLVLGGTDGSHRVRLGLVLFLIDPAVRLAQRIAFQRGEQALLVGVEIGRASCRERV